MNVNLDELQFEFKFRDEEKFPAQMTLIIGQFKIKGFSVRKSNYEDSDVKFVLYPPASPAGHNKWIKLFWTSSKPDWKMLEEKAIKQFNNEHEEYLLSNVNTKEIDIDKVF
jgi:hypothetical protein